MTSQPLDGLQLTVDDLEDRAAMPADVRVKISFLKQDLAALLGALPGQLAGQLFIDPLSDP